MHSYDIKKYLPLVLVEVYLITTLAMFLFGPIKYKIHNSIIFYCLIFLCHAYFIIGYFFALKLKSTRRSVNINIGESSGHYWVLFSVGMVGIWAAYKNIMLMEGIIPYDFFDNLIKGFTEPGVAYTERMLNLEAGQSAGSRIFNIFSLFFSFSKLLFVFYCLYFWTELGVLKRIGAFIYSLLFISSGISAGVNSVIFLFFIFSAVSTVVILYVRNYVYLKQILLFTAFIFLIPVSWFGGIMSERGGGFEYFASTSPLGDIGSSSVFVLDDGATFFDFLYYSFVWLTYYICQGYYGLSLILNLDLNWTYGFGNSEFLQRQFLMIFGEDISLLTFQTRVDHLWGKSAQWHSFYGQFANDVGFVGLPLLMFMIAFYFARVWKTVLLERNFYGLALIPIFAIMFIFFPANNQVFGYIDTISYFFVLSFLWLFQSSKRI